MCHTYSIKLAPSLPSPSADNPGGVVQAPCLDQKSFPKDALHHAHLCFCRRALTNLHRQVVQTAQSRPRTLLVGLLLSLFAARLTSRPAIIGVFDIPCDHPSKGGRAFSKAIFLFPEPVSPALAEQSLACRYVSPNSPQLSKVHYGTSLESNDSTRSFILLISFRLYTKVRHLCHFCE